MSQNTVHPKGEGRQPSRLDAIALLIYRNAEPPSSKESNLQMNRSEKLKFCKFITGPVNQNYVTNHNKYVTVDSPKQHVRAGIKKIRVKLTI